MPDPTISLLTIVHGRRDHLGRMLRGIAQSSLLPDEVIIVHMNEPIDRSLTIAGAELIQLAVRTGDGRLPLAAARCAAAARAGGEVLLFLDVDCIPAPDFIERMLTAVMDTGALVMGDPHYLPADWQQREAAGESLDSLALPHPDRQLLTPELAVLSDAYHMFWSLCFGCKKTTHQQIGGFDPGYGGYGGEDTDFAFAARRAGVPFYLLGARVYHQHHPVQDPPLQHLEDIVSNARYFQQKWGCWPMEGWLRAFRRAGVIRWEGDEVEVV